MPPGTVALNLALRTSNQPVPGDIAAAAMGKSLAQRGADMAAANLGRSLMNQANQGNFGNMGMSGSMPFGGMSRRSGLGAPPPMGMGFDGEGIVPPPKPGTNNDLMYVFWITIIIGLFEIVMMFKKYNFLNVTKRFILVIGGVLYSFNFLTQLLRQKLRKSLFGSHRPKHPPRPHLAVHLRLDVLVATLSR